VIAAPLMALPGILLDGDSVAGMPDPRARQDAATGRAGATVPWVDGLFVGPGKAYIDVSSMRR
jgi:hypothetical protein